MRKISSIFMLVMILLLGGIFTSCSEIKDAFDNPFTDYLRYDTTDMIISVGQSQKRTPEYQSTKITLSFSSSDESIAVVTEDGTVTGISEGVATITVIPRGVNDYYNNEIFAIKNVTYRCIVNPREEAKKTESTINYEVKYMEKYLGAESFVNPLTITGDGTVTYTSSDTSVATVDSETGQVTIVSNGSALITATVEDGEKSTYPTQSVSYSLAVGKKVGFINYSPNTVEKQVGESGIFNKLNIIGDGTIYYTSSNPQVAIVNSTTGEVATLGPGASLIMAVAYDSETYVYPAKLALYSLAVGKKAGTISYSRKTIDKDVAAPAFTNELKKTGDGTVTYSSSDPSVATVDEFTGQVTICGAGSTTITAVVDDSNQYAYAEPSVSYTLSVGKLAGSINYGSTAVEKQVGDDKFANELTIIGDGIATYTSSNTSVATVNASSGVVTIVGEGSTAIVATVSDGYQYAYSEKTAFYVLSVGKKAGTISYKVKTVSKILGDADFTNPLVKTGDGALSFSSSEPSVATVDAKGKVSIKGNGSTLISATVSDSHQFAYAQKNVSYSLTVGKKSGAISYGVTSIEKNIDDKPFTNPLKLKGDGTVTYSSSNASVASVDATGLVTIKAAGNAVIKATVSDGHYYAYAVPTASYTLKVGKKTGSIGFTSTSITKNVGDDAFTNTLTKIGDGKVYYSSSDESVATVNTSGLVTIKAKGTTTITATVSDTDKYAYATNKATFKLTVGQKSGAILYDVTTVEKQVGDGDFTNPLTISGDGKVTYSSSDTNVATVSSTGVVTVKTKGSTTITATVSDSEKYTYATKTASYTLNVGLISGSISYASTSVEKTFGDADFTNPLTITGDGPVTYKSSDTNVATVDATGKVSVKGAGSVKITATVSDTETYSYATKTASYTLSINKHSASISYATTSISKQMGAAAFTNALTNTGDGNVSYKSSNTNVAKVDAAGKVTLTGLGTATITATVTDGINYTYPSKTATFTVTVKSDVTTDTNFNSDTNNWNNETW